MLVLGNCCGLKEIKHFQSMLLWEENQFQGHKSITPAVFYFLYIKHVVESSIFTRRLLRY